MQIEYIGFLFIIIIFRVSKIVFYSCFKKSIFLELSNVKKFRKYFFILFLVTLLLGIFLFNFSGARSTTNIDPEPKIDLEPKIYFCTYGDERFKESRQRIADEAKKLGCFDDVFIFTSEKLSEDFKNKYADILSKERGGGYWIWKFEVLKQTLELAEEGDYIFYSDAGSSFYPGFEKEIEDWIELLEESEYKNLSFQMEYIERQWTVDELFKLIESKYPEKSSDIQKSKIDGQLFATAMLIKNDTHSRSLIQKCFDLIDFDNNIITDEYNNKNREDNKEFSDNRHDQSVLSCVRKLWGTTIMKESEIKYWSATRIRK